MSLEAAITIKLFGSAAALCSKYLLDTPIDAETFAIAQCLPAFRRTNRALDARLKAHTDAMNERIAEAGHADKAEQLAAAAEDVLALALKQDFRDSLRETGLDGGAIWARIAALEAVKERLSPVNADGPIRNLVPGLMTGLFDAWACDPATLDGLRKFQINLIIEANKTGEDSNRRIRDLQTQVQKLGTMLEAVGGQARAEELREKGLSDDQLLALAQAFEAAHQPKAHWFDLLIEKAELLKDLQGRLSSTSNADPQVGVLHGQARTTIEAGDFGKAEQILAEAEDRGAEAAAAIRQDHEGNGHDLAQPEESQAASAFLRGELAEAQLRYAEAHGHYRRAHDLAPDNADYLRKAQNFAYRAGDYPAAIELAEKQRSVVEEVYGPESRNFVFALNELAVALKASGNFAEAELLYRRILKTAEDASGSDRSHLATILNNLALLYSGQGKTAEAEPLYKRAIEIGERMLGPDHPDVAIRLNNLAELYSTQGKFEAAEPLYKRALDIGERTLGPDHPNVATRLNNLAALYGLVVY